MRFAAGAAQGFECGSLATGALLMVFLDFLLIYANTKFGLEFTNIGLLTVVRSYMRNRLLLASELVYQLKPRLF